MESVSHFGKIRGEVVAENSQALTEYEPIDYVNLGRTTFGHT
jgi:hypothetical protein